MHILDCDEGVSNEKKNGGINTVVHSKRLLYFKVLVIHTFILIRMYWKTEGFFQCVSILK